MSTNINRYKIASGIQFGWDVPAMLSKISKVRIPYGIWMDRSSEELHFSRGFHKTFPNENAQVFQVMCDLQATCAKLDNPSELIRDFLNYNLDPSSINSSCEGVTLIRTVPGEYVKPHTDGVRLLSVNIGLVNSNIGETQVADTRNTSEFYQSNIESFTMEDGDAYLLRVGNVHAVRPLTLLASGPNRWIISMCVKL